MKHRRTDWRIGLVRLLDVAPFIMAGELGYYREAGLTVQLSWELGWSSIKHKLAYGQLDAAHALAPLALSIARGYEVAATPCRALQTTSRMGNGITLGRHIRERGVSTADDFRQEVRSSRGRTRYTLGVVSLDSCHHILLRQWLRGLKLDPDQDVRIVVIPPGQALRNLRAGTLDGYCVGEPWNSLAVKEDLGWVLALSQDLMPDHVEKVLMVREETCQQRPDDLAGLQLAISRACAYCANPEHASEVARKMRRSVVLGAAARGMEKILRGEFDYGAGQGEEIHPVLTFCNTEQTRLQSSDIQWLVEGAMYCGWLNLPMSEAQALADKVYAVK